MKEKKAMFTYNGKTVEVKNEDPSAKGKFIDEPWDKLMQEVYDQLDDSQKFTKEELNDLCEMAKEPFLNCLKEN